MPLLEANYQPPRHFRHAHVNTIYPSLFRQVKGVEYTRQRVELPDGDFLDLDWARSGQMRLVVVLHGLEGSAANHYVKGMIRWFGRHGWDGLGINFRGCSGESNRLLRTYHVGDTGDVAWVLEQVERQSNYHSIFLVGFSLGGNVLLKYFGEKGSEVSNRIIGGAAFSVPCHIPSANLAIKHWQNYFYLQRFLKTLNAKMREKARLWPHEYPLALRRAANFDQFDEVFTARVHGFASALDYWTRSSSKQYLAHLRRPVLLANAQDDTFLSKECFPVAEAQQSPYLHLKIPRWGGHCGFYLPPAQQAYWSELEALKFAEQLLGEH